MLVQALAMTGSDLCSAAKPWDAQIQTAEIIYAEFHEQVNQSSNFTAMPVYQLLICQGMAVPYITDPHKPRADSRLSAQ